MTIQGALAGQIVTGGAPESVRYVAAADVAYRDRPYPRRPKEGRAAVIVMSYPKLELVESHVVDGQVEFPYVPGLLSFREIPILAQAFDALQVKPGLLLVDGQGLAHPRRLGIASHLGLLLDIPTIGVAKSRLIGEHTVPGLEAGSRAELRDGREVIGLALRTRDRVAPVYVSIGHKIGLAEAAEWVLRLCRGYRLPEPARLADHLSKGKFTPALRSPHL